MALRALSDRSDVASAHAFDVRKQEVRSRIGNERIGTVDDVLVDDENITRYLSIDVDGENRRVLLPIGQAEADQQKNIIWVAGLNRGSFRNLPEYSRDPGSVSPEYEAGLHSAYESAYPEEHYYERPEYRSAGWRGADDRTETGRLERLENLRDIDVASDDPDPRGWKVIGSDGRELGTIDHLIGDTGAMRVRYLVMNVNRDILGESREVLIPVGQVDLDTDRNRVIVDALDATLLKTVPVYTGGTITREQERNVNSAFAAAHTGERRYGHPRYREHLFYGGSAARASTPADRTKNSESEDVRERPPRA